MSMAEQRRALLPFLQRAEEVQKVEPKVAYYCRLYAVEEGLKLQNRDKAIDELLFSVMEKLEAFKSKNELKAEEDKLHLEGFALKIFDRADRVDRAGRADMSTCKAFYAASVFMEVCTQFGALDEDLLGKQKYAAWKAADIRKAIREGRKPTVGSGEFRLHKSSSLSLLLTATMLRLARRRRREELWSRAEGGLQAGRECLARARSGALFCG